MHEPDEIVNYNPIMMGHRITIPPFMVQFDQNKSMADMEEMVVTQKHGYPFIFIPKDKLLIDVGNGIIAKADVREAWSIKDGSPPPNYSPWLLQFNVAYAYKEDTGGIRPWDRDNIHIGVTNLARLAVVFWSVEVLLTYKQLGYIVVLSVSCTPLKCPTMHAKYTFSFSLVDRCW